MDAAYLRETLGQVVAKGCAETIAAAPVDPVHHLSLWLFKYVENVKIIAEFQKERDGLLQKQAAKTNKLKEEETIRQEKIQKQIDRIVELRLIQNDPYLLFDECLKAVLEFTGGTSAYVSLVLDKPWEPPKKAPDSEDGEEMPDNEAAEEEEEEDKEEDEKEKEEELDEGDSGMSQENEGNDQENQGDDQQNEGEVMNDKIEGANNPDEVKKKKIKRRKPPNYKKKILLYVAATLDNQFIVNKRLDKKLGPVSFSVLLKGLPNLHVANVLYQEGMHFFQGLPLMGAYFTIPVMLNGDDPQVMKDYSSLNEMDLNKWTLSDIYLDGITEAQLSEEVPVGYLAHQWLLIAKKVAFETMKCKDLKTRNESASKDFADVELEQMVADIDLRVAIDEEKKLALQVEDVQSKLANEISAGRSDDVQENAAEDEDVEE